MLGSRSGDNVGVSSHQHPRLQSPRSHTPGEGAAFTAPESTHVLDLSAEPETVPRDEEEDGWVSDQSWPEYAPVEMGHQQTAKGPRSRSNKRRRTDRHRSSAHVHHHARLPSHTAIDAPTSSTKSTTAPATGSSTPATDAPSSLVSEASPSPTDTVDEEPRGRRLPATSTVQTLPRHMRIMSLRGSGIGSREVSPVRSIRWADAGAGASSATGRWPQAPSAQGSRAPSPGPPTPGEPVEPDLG
jgi:hypothetical protein